MLLKFLPYFQPTHYFRLQRKGTTFIFPKVEYVAKFLIQKVEKDNSCKSGAGNTYEQFWLLVLRDYI
jgi:hypothetical protein